MPPSVNRLKIDNIRSTGLGPVSLVVAAQECVCISGSSGSGKTRLLRAIADLDVHEGEAFLDGVSRDRFSAPEWRRQVGLLPPQSQWWLDRVAEHFANFENRWSGQSSLEQLGLNPHLLEATVESLSSGERQRLALLRLLANHPAILLLDEPTANLDPVNVLRVEALIASYRTETGAALLWVSHDPEQIQRVGTRHLRMVNGLITDDPDEHA